MRFAIVENSIVLNIVVGDRTTLELIYSSPQYELVNVDNLQCDLDWKYVDGVFLPVERRSLEQVKQDALTALNQACQAEINNGFESDALGSMHRYSSQLEDQINLIGATIGALAGEAIAYVCIDLASGEKTARWHTPQQMIQVMQSGKQLKENALGKFHRLRSHVEATESIEEIQAISWST
jgi:hypothetical protein